MSFAAVSTVGDQQLGEFLKIISRGVVYNNLNEDAIVWEMIKKMKKGPIEGREQRFLVRSAYGDDAVAFVPPSGDYPDADQSTVVEGVTRYKDFALTIDVERSLIEKAKSDFSKYGDLLKEEIRAKTVAMSRMLSGAVYADGTGVIAQALDAGSISSGKTIFNVSGAYNARGFIGWVGKKAKLVPKNADGTAAAPTVASGTFSYYLVDAIDRKAGTLTLIAKDAAHATLTVQTSTGLTAGDVLYKKNAGTFNDLTAISTNDYNTISNYFVGLDSLTANDSRKVNGITLNTDLGGTINDLEGGNLNPMAFQELMSDIMIAVGQGRYKYNRALMSWGAMNALTEEREVDRRFDTVKDGIRGVEGIGYQFGKQALMFEADEFCPDQRIYVLPQSDVLQFYGSDFQFVNPQGGNGEHFILKNASTGQGHARSNRGYMEGNAALQCVHAPALGVIKNFVI